MSVATVKKRLAFTLIEMLIVCFIIGVLSAVAVPTYRRSVERTRVAEALTLMRAIYDSCERLAWEHQEENCARGIDSGVVSFRKLDILAKGTFQNDYMSFLTENFLYSFNEDDNNITARAMKGNYAGSIITFNGKDFECFSGSGSEEAAQACEVWGANSWNQ